MLNTKQIQINLKFLNYYKGNIDGILGEQTKNAILNFQMDNELKQDGIYGKETEAILVPMIERIQTKIGTEADGIAGENTKKKLEEYQKNNGLTADGIAGVKTRAKMFSTEIITWDTIEHFKQSEFECKDGCGYDDIDLRLVKILDQIRDHFNSPVIVASGCRCKKHNAEVGGVQGSRHVLGKASDIYVKGISTNDLLTYTKELVANGTLRYTYTNSTSMNGVVHVDIQ